MSAKNSLNLRQSGYKDCKNAIKMQSQNAFINTNSTLAQLTKYNLFQKEEIKILKVLRNE